jgi:hypothetical protein
MADEKNFENRLKKYLQSLGVYPLGYPKNKMTVPPVGYYEKRWGGGYSKSGLPDMHIVLNGISIDVELKASNGKPSELQVHNIRQINESGSIGILLYPEGFESFKEIMKGVMECKLHIQELNALKVVGANTKCAILKS